MGSILFFWQGAAGTLPMGTAVWKCEKHTICARSPSNAGRHSLIMGAGKCAADMEQRQAGKSGCQSNGGGLGCSKQQGYPGHILRTAPINYIRPAEFEGKLQRLEDRRVMT